MVDDTTTSQGARQWDKVAKENLHRILAVDVDGVVVSAPIIEPTQTSFTSFDGNGEISGGRLTHAEAQRIAAAMSGGG